MPSGGEQKHQSAQREVRVTAVQEIAGIECVQVSMSTGAGAPGIRHPAEVHARLRSLSRSGRLRRAHLKSPNACPNEGAHRATDRQSRQDYTAQRERVGQDGIREPVGADRPKQHLQIEPKSCGPGQQDCAPRQMLSQGTDLASQCVQPQKQVNQGRDQEWKNLAQRRNHPNAYAVSCRKQRAIRLSTGVIRATAKKMAGKTIAVSLAIIAARQATAEA